MPSLQKDVGFDIEDIPSRKWLLSLAKTIRQLYDTHSFSGPPLKSQVNNLWDSVRAASEPHKGLQKISQSFEWLKPVMLCIPPDSMTGDAANAFCGVSTEVLNGPNCIIYSFGDDNYQFEDLVVKNTKCSIYVFDCTIVNRAVTSLQHPRIQFFPFCLGNPDSKAVRAAGFGPFSDLKGVMKKLKHEKITLLKMDIESFEHDLLASWNDETYTPCLISMKFHLSSEPVNGMYRRKAMGELLVEILHLYFLGYRVAFVAPAGEGVEITLFKLNCEF